MTIQMNPCVRLRPPSSLFDKSRWTAEDLLQRRRFALPSAGVLALVACMEPRERREIVEDVASRSKISRNRVDSLIHHLQKANLIVTELSDEAKWFKEVVESWASSGWTEAAEYHLAAYDYQFVHTGREGPQEGIRIMKEYGAEKADTDRVKPRYEDALDRIALPKPEECEDAASSFEWLEEGEDADSLEGCDVVDRRVLSALLSVVFGKIGELGISWSGSPLMRRTSPSGGGRNPTECYVVVIDVPGLEPGWYHVHVDPPELELLSRNDVDQPILVDWFPATFGRAPFPISAILVLTSLFERNMYRYREPRTFRTVHMDAGHLIASAEVVANSFGVDTFVQHAANHNAVEKKLGLDGLQEGYLLSMALSRERKVFSGDDRHP